MADQLNVSDPVVCNDGSRQLEGVVAYKGPVQFVTDDADMIGVRLTGGCVGLGTNNGSVDGKEYFSCPPNCGLFVPAASVTKRQMTRLEELRLKRELAGTTKKPPAATASSAKSDPAPPIAAAAAAAAPSLSMVTPKKTSEPVTERKRVVPSAPALPATESKPTVSKLEQLRLRRAALNEKKEITKAAIAAPPASIAKPFPIVAAASTSKLSPVEAMAASTAKSPTADSTAKLSPAQSVAAAATAASTTPAIASRDVPSISSPAMALQEEEISKLTKEIQSLKESLSAVQKKLGDKENEAASFKSKLDVSEKELDDAKTKLEAAAATTVDSSDRDKEIATLQMKLASTESELQDTKAMLELAKSARPQVVVSSASNEKEDERVATLESAVQDWKAKAQDALSEVTNLKRSLEQEKQGHATLADDLQVARSDAATLRKEMQILSERAEQRGTTDNSHYKELARLQADVGAQKRKVDALEKEKLDMEATIEDLTLDKEQLLEEKEALEDRVDELRLDAETAQMEVEELKMEVEDARQASADTPGVVQGAAATGDAEEVAAALSTQNARLREALMRLREQTQFEKMELLRQIRDAEKDAESGRLLVNEVEDLRSLKTNQDEQISDLKDMVEQGAAFEQMVEDLTDRLFSLEEENVSLRTVVRELEEAAELTAEMEEVQGDELRALSRDLEGRDAIIHNLEEAVKIQRRREEDFLRTVGNYRSTIAMLNQEKQALLELHQGGEGEKSDLLAASQGALARASQLVSDAASTRKREALAILDSIDKEVYKTLALRFEMLLPSNIVGLEVSAIKGELLASKVINLGSKTLEGIAGSLARTIRPASPSIDEYTESALSTIQLSDDVRQKVASALYQAEFARTVVDASSNLKRLLAACLWPDQLSHEASANLASTLGHSVDELDSVLGGILRSLTEEGELSVEQANLGALQQTVNATMHNLESDIEREGETLVSKMWNPPGWELLKDASIAKFACQGVAAALSLIVDFFDDDKVPVAVAILHRKIEKASIHAQTACLRLSSLDVKNDNLVTNLSILAKECEAAALSVFEEAKLRLLSEGQFGPCDTAADILLQTLAKFSSALRAADLSENGDRHHPLSAEANDCWQRLAGLCSSIRSVDGDEDELNHLVRARVIERQLTEAFENATKLELANMKVVSLEKTVATKSKEVMLQTARLSELEKEIAKGGAHISRTIDLTASDEFGRLSEENRVLHDAMLHWQTKAEEYELALRDFKSPVGKGSKSRTPRRGIITGSDTTHYGAAADDKYEDVGVLEATLFRPALQQVLRDASKWKASAIASHLQDLPPLHAPGRSSITETQSSGGGSSSSSLLELASAISDYRIVRAACTIVDLTNTEKSPRAQLREMHSKNVAASERLHSIVSRCSIMTV